MHDRARCVGIISVCLCSFLVSLDTLSLVSESHAQRRFEQVEGRAVDIGVGADGEVWVVNQVEESTGVKVRNGCT